MGDLTDYEAIYRKRSPRSREAYERARKVLPGGVCHAIRHFPPYPFFVTSAKGTQIEDVDGNRYVDYWMGHCALLLGHGHPRVLEALRSQMEDGLHWGIVNPWQVELAEAVVRMVPCAEEVRFCNTGAEATSYAVRLARGATGRSTVLKAEGGWHGYCTDLLKAVHFPVERPESQGLPASLDRDVSTFPFNDIEGATAAIREAEDLAAVIVEPVLGAGGAIPAEPAFLRALQEETRERDALLIFDEVITGFRLAPGGGQEHYGIVPDLVTLGKILGGGLPVGAVAGRRDLLELTRPGGRVAIGGGTFSCNPMTMRAGLATLTYAEDHPGLYEHIDRLGERVRRSGEAALVDAGIEAVATGVGSLFQFHFLEEEGVEIRSAADVYAHTDRARGEEEFKLRLANEGVYTMHGGGCISLPHTDEEVRGFAEALQVVAGAMAEATA